MNMYSLIYSTFLGTIISISHRYSYSPHLIYSNNNNNNNNECCPTVQNKDLFNCTNFPNQNLSTHYPLANFSVLFTGVSLGCCLYAIGVK